MLGYFKRETYKDVELVRMANGDYCLVRPLGLVPGGKGMRHHENLLRLTAGGIAAKIWTFAKMGVRILKPSDISGNLTSQQPVPVKISQQPSRASARD